LEALVEMRVQIEPRPECADPAALVEQLEKTFQNSFSLRVPVTTVPSGTLPRFEMKARRWIRE
jgi:phenylacetate-coenzyme A ligase PaaK-like adenylate-forming protein